MRTPTGRRPSQPEMQDLRHRHTRQDVVSTDFTELEARILAQNTHLLDEGKRFGAAIGSFIKRYRKD